MIVTPSNSCLALFPTSMSAVIKLLLLLQNPATTNQAALLIPARGLTVEGARARRRPCSLTRVSVTRAMTTCSIPLLSHATKNVQLEGTARIRETARRTHRIRALGKAPVKLLTALQALSPAVG
ncbi:uncharacterized protein LOC125192134 [Salvia hispanica]|uniref:uncharacterized protein LOC125192134 n=1 Tax=Salvia hispanica TaxID=49212 RepID=UPI0020094B2C|nr:uncharacterized protein LOC125192134 [Salvia hispanica]